MSAQENLPPDLKELERELGAFAPHLESRTQDELIVSIGKAARPSGIGHHKSQEMLLARLEKSRRHWQQLCAALAASLLLLAGWQVHSLQHSNAIVATSDDSAGEQESESATSSENVVQVAASSGTKRRLGEPGPSALPYLKLRNEILSDGIDALPQPPAGRAYVQRVDFVPSVQNLLTEYLPEAS